MKKELIFMDKPQIRKEMIAKRNELSRKQILDNSEKIFDRLYSSPLYENANTIMIYVSIGNEIFTHDFIQRSISKGKKILVPKCEPNSRKIILSHVIDFERDLEKGFKGLIEPKKETLRPVSSDELDLILVPGLSFTKAGHRLGYGGGYYDRFLADISKDIPKVALTLELQIVDTLPIESYDVPMDFILTEERLIQCK